MNRPTPGAWLLLGTAVLQVVSIPVAGFSQSEGEDPTVVPPGPFFAIWAVIVLGCLGSAVYGLRADRARRSPWRQVQLPLSATQVLFALWLLTAATAELLTVPVFVAMLALLLVALRAVLASRSDGPTSYLLGGTLGLYAGWASAAVWLNVITLLPLDDYSTGLALQLQAAAVAAGALTVALVTVWLEAWPPYVAAGAWALVGVTVSSWSADEPLLWSTAAAGLLVTGAASAAGVVRLGRSRSGRTTGPGTRSPVLS